MRTWLQAGRYASVAVQSAASDWLVFTALVTLGADDLLAQGVGRGVGGVVSFVANKLWAFRSPGGHGLAREVTRFLTLYAFSYALSLGLFALGSELLGPWLAKAVADTTCFLVNFVVMRAWVFARGSAQRVAQPGDADAGPGEQIG